MVEIRDAVAREKRRRGELGFDDMLSRLDEALRGDSGETLAIGERQRGGQQRLYGAKQGMHRRFATGFGALEQKRLGKFLQRVGQLVAGAGSRRRLCC